MEEQFVVSGWVYFWAMGSMVHIGVGYMVSGSARGSIVGGGVFFGLMAIKRIVEDAVNYLAVS